MASNKCKTPETKSQSESESSQSNTNTYSSENEESATSSPPSSPPSKKPVPTPTRKSSSSSDGDTDLHVKSTPKDIPTTTTTTNDHNGESSKKSFQRIFSEDDEVLVLKALIAFKDQTAEADCKGFVLNSLHGKFTKLQLADKIHRLKKKFTNIDKKKRKNLSAHDKLLVDLSRKIWEVDSDDNDVVAVSNSVSKKRKETEQADCDGNSNDNNDVKDADFKVREEGMNEALRIEALRRMGKKKREEIRAMWRDVEIAQLKVDRMRYRARAKEHRSILKALGSCD